MGLGPQLTSFLKKYGLSDLTDWASQAIIDDMSEEQLYLEIYEQPKFQQRFAGIFAREKAGYPPISIDDYLSYEDIAASLGTSWGFRMSKEEVDNLIGNNVSAKELEGRFTITATAVYESDINTRTELGRLFNIDGENLMRYWMDPKATLGTLQQQYKMGEIAGAAMRTGFGRLNIDQAARLQQAGLTGDQAQTGFSELAGMSELFIPLDEGEDLFSMDQQIDVLTGNADAAKELQKRQAKRKGEFEGSGGFASGEEGFSTGRAD